MDEHAGLLRNLVEHWLQGLEQAIADGDPDALSDLFQDDSYWRDLLALTWSIQTIDGRDALAGALLQSAAATGARNFRIDPGRTEPRAITRVETKVIEAIFAFETEQGTCEGVVRLALQPDAGRSLRAWTLLTSLEAIKGHEERIGANRPSDAIHARDFGGPNWLDKRQAAQSYKDREPTVLVVGAGHAGLSIAARLTHLGVDTLIIDRHERIGDNWRKRYHALALHNRTDVNHLPYMPFPPTWPAYLPKDMLAHWLDAYAASMELNFWTGIELERGAYDDEAGRWEVTLRRRDGSTCKVHPNHIVMATGVSGMPNQPDIATLQNFKGKVIHSSRYRDGHDWMDRRALVIGSGNSGHDVAQDLHASGAKVTMVQRSPTLVVNVEPSAQLVYDLYQEGPPLDDCDLITTAMPLPLMREAHRRITERAKALDRDLLDGLKAAGFKLDFGEDETGWQFKYLTRGGGYYFNVGCSDLIVAGEIGLLQLDEIGMFTASGAMLRNEDHLTLDLVVLATGFKGLEALVEQKFGAEIAARVGPVWGFGDSFELRNMYGRTAQPGLWFIAGSFAQCRIYSRYLGMQIKACEEGLLTKQKD